MLLGLATILCLETAGCTDEQTDPHWRPDEVEPIIHQALADKVGKKFTVLIQPPSELGAVCGLVTPEGKKTRFFVWNGSLTMQPDLKGEDQAEGIALLSFMQFKQEACGR